MNIDDRAQVDETKTPESFTDKFTVGTNLFFFFRRLIPQRNNYTHTNMSHLVLMSCKQTLSASIPIGMAFRKFWRKDYVEKQLRFVLKSRSVYRS